MHEKDEFDARIDGNDFAAAARLYRAEAAIAPIEHAA
jgi:hypothetical protein